MFCNSSNKDLIIESYRSNTVTLIKMKIPNVSMSNVSLAQNVIKLLCGHNKTSFKNFFSLVHSVIFQACR